jgi:hypothetical protein
VGAALVPIIGPGGLAVGAALTGALSALGTKARNESAKPGSSRWWKLATWLG